MLNDFQQEVKKCSKRQSLCQHLKLINKLKICKINAQQKGKGGYSRTLTHSMSAGKIY